MPSLSSISDPKVYHILTYGTLLGSNLFQARPRENNKTFMNGPIAYSSLPRPQFSTLQQKIFPPYFAVHTALPLLLALTWPGERALEAATIGIGGASLATPGGWTRSGNGWRGLYEGGEGKNFWTAVVPMGLMFGTSLLNLLVLGPATTKVMRERKHQETRDGKRYYDEGPQSEEMQRMNTSFMWLHSASSLSNLVGLGAMLYYGVVLAEKL